jgi:hypothetical protein
MLKLLHAERQLVYALRQAVHVLPQVCELGLPACLRRTDRRQKGGED